MNNVKKKLVVPLVAAGIIAIGGISTGAAFAAGENSPVPSPSGASPTETGNVDQGAVGDGQSGNVDEGAVGDGQSGNVDEGAVGDGQSGNVDQSAVGDGQSK